MLCNGRPREATATATLENDESRQAFSRLQVFQILRQTAAPRTIVASEDGSPSRWTMFVPASLCSAAVSAFCRLQRTLRSHGPVHPSGRQHEKKGGRGQGVKCRAQERDSIRFRLAHLFRTSSRYITSHYFGTLNRNRTVRKDKRSRCIRQSLW